MTPEHREPWWHGVAFAVTFAVLIYAVALITPN